MSGNFERLSNLAAIEEHGFGEVWRAFLAGLPVADFDDPTVAEDFVAADYTGTQTRGGNPPSRHATVVWGGVG